MVVHSGRRTAFGQTPKGITYDGAMKLYHAATRANAENIAKHGFIDPNGGKYVGAGVWFAERSLIGHSMFEGEDVDSYVTIDVPDISVLEEYRAEKSPDEDFDGWEIPHDIANRYFTDRTVYP